LLSFIFAKANKCSVAREHFKECARFMLANHKRADATEGFGEICAAMYVLENYPGYKMIWGFHLHSGAGIDQIWKNEKKKKYLIVEAKGVGIDLKPASQFVETIDDRQMGLEWVGDRLFRMEASWDGFAKLKANLSLEAVSVNDGQTSKSYYRVTQLNPTWTIWGIGVQGNWRADCTPYGKLIMAEKQYVFTIRKS